VEGKSIDYKRSYTGIYLPWTVVKKHDGAQRSMAEEIATEITKIEEAVIKGTVIERVLQSSVTGATTVGQLATVIGDSVTGVKVAVGMATEQAGGTIIGEMEANS
jgi:hypothetical protein